MAEDRPGQPAYEICSIKRTLNVTLNDVGVSACWTQQNDVHGFTDRAEPGIDSVDECKSACLRSSWCVAIDFDAANPQAHYCWLLNDTVTMAATGIVHYVLDRNCLISMCT